MNKDRSKVTESDRERTKRIVYSVMYGVGTRRYDLRLPRPLIPEPCLSESDACFIF